GQARLQGVPGRVAAARILVALVLAGRGLRVRRGGVDRDDRRPGGGVGLLAGVDGPRGETLLVHRMRPFNEASGDGPKLSYGACGAKWERREPVNGNIEYRTSKFRISNGRNTRSVVRNSIFLVRYSIFPFTGSRRSSFAVQPAHSSNRTATMRPSGS